MAEGKGTPTSEQGKDSDKRPPWWKRWWKRLWEWTEFGKKTGWNWLDLLSALAIPVVLAIFGVWFTAQQDARQEQIADQRAQDQALQAYLGEMSTLMTGRDPLRESEEGSEVRTLARARTLTALGRLSPGRKATILRFLYEANLIDRPNPIIELDGANLKRVTLRDANLSGGSFRTFGLYGSDRKIPFGPGSPVGGDPADLSGADLSNANLKGALLFGVGLQGANLSHADLSHATMALGGNDNPKYTADLSGANLRSTNLQGTILHYVNLGGAILIGADLSDAQLFCADLSNAILAQATGVTDDMLEEDARSLKGATMPGGQKAKDSLKGKEVCGEEGENSGPS